VSPNRSQNPQTGSELPAAGAVDPSPTSAQANRRKYVTFTIFALISLILDQVTKVMARQTLKVHGPKVVISGWFDLRYAENPGVAFSMLQDIPGGFLSLVAVGAFLLVLYYLRRMPAEHRRLHVALGLVGGGALGNLLDRVLYGRVTDFIVWKARWGGRVHEWPAFNIADAALCIGVGLMVLDMFNTKKQAPPEPA
jgi:signal peptidase II